MERALARKELTLERRRIKLSIYRRRKMADREAAMAQILASEAIDVQDAAMEEVQNGGAVEEYSSTNRHQRAVAVSHDRRIAKKRKRQQQTKKALEARKIKQSK
jgi:hypothetical protein